MFKMIDTPYKAIDTTDQYNTTLKLHQNAAIVSPFKTRWQPYMCVCVFSPGSLVGIKIEQGLGDLELNPSVNKIFRLKPRQTWHLPASCK